MENKCDFKYVLYLIYVAQFIFIKYKKLTTLILS